MKIVQYNGLGSKMELLPILYLAFGWPFDPDQVQELIDADPRLNTSPIGFCAMEGDHPVGFVGVMELPTRNIDGDLEFAGGIWGVSTLPTHVKKGISTALMNEAHDHFLRKGYRFSFLTTRRTFIAYGFYRTLAYEDAMDFPSAYKSVPDRKAPTEKPDAEADWKGILDIYNKFSARKTGFVLRDVNYLKMLMKRAALDHAAPEKVLLGEEGYIFYSKTGNTLCIDEAIPSDEGKTEKLIQKIEDRAGGLIYDRLVASNNLLRAYRSLGYMTHTQSHGLLMAKPLTGNPSFKQVYGDAFCMTSQDGF